MTNAIGEFIKSVFPSTVNRSGEVFKALLADGEGGGSIEAIFEDLEETRAAWQDVLDAYSLLEEQNEKLWGARVAPFAVGRVGGERLHGEKQNAFRGGQGKPSPVGQRL